MPAPPSAAPHSLRSRAQKVASLNHASSAPHLIFEGGVSNQRFNTTLRPTGIGKSASYARPTPPPVSCLVSPLPSSSDSLRLHHQICTWNTLQQLAFGSAPQLQRLKHPTATLAADRWKRTQPAASHQQLHPGDIHDTNKPNSPDTSPLHSVTTLKRQTGPSLSDIPRRRTVPKLGNAKIQHSSKTGQGDWPL